MKNLPHFAKLFTAPFKHSSCTVGRVTLWMGEVVTKRLACAAGVKDAEGEN